MIVEHLKSKRPPKVYEVTHYTQSKQLSHQEYLVRDRLIKKLYAECPYKFGDIVRANNDKDFKKEGLYKITGVCSTWYAYKGSAKNDVDVEWSENPKLVTAMCLKTNAVVEATTNYFRLATDEEKTTDC